MHKQLFLIKLALLLVLAVFVETNIYIQPLPSLDQRVVSDMEGHGRELKSSWPNSIASNMPFSVSARICANTDN